MIRLELTNQSAVLENFNPRVEKDGPDKVPAADLKFTCSQSPDVLAFFSPTLKAHLFNENGPRDLADGMPLRYPHIDYPITLDEEMTGATLTIDYGVEEKLTFLDAKVNQFRITPREGGSVLVGFRVQCRPDEKAAARLYTLQERAVTLSLDPSELAEMKAAAAA